MEKREIVGRAELKLQEAVENFGFDFREKTVLDIGSSTGGFTELALRLGARKVFAVEKGTRQMKAPLRFDPRIELFEKTDIFEVTAEDNCDGEVVLGEFPDVIVADVSFVSLMKVLKYARRNLATVKTDFLVMMKPQFEAKAFQLNKGVVKNEKMRREIIRNFENQLVQNGFLVCKKRDNDLRGKNGNQERFYWLTLAKRASKEKNFGKTIIK